MQGNADIQLVHITGLSREVLQDLTLRIHPRLLLAADRQKIDRRNVVSEIIGVDSSDNCALEIVLPKEFKKEIIDEALRDAIYDFDADPRFSNDLLAGLKYTHSTGEVIVGIARSSIREQVKVGGERGI